MDKGRFLGDLGEGEKENTVAKVIERIRAHYKVQDLDMGKVRVEFRKARGRV